VYIHISIFRVPKGLRISPLKYIKGKKILCPKRIFESEKKKQFNFEVKTVC